MDGEQESKNLSQSRRSNVTQRGISKVNGSKVISGRDNPRDVPASEAKTSPVAYNIRNFRPLRLEHVSRKTFEKVSEAAKRKGRPEPKVAAFDTEDNSKGEAFLGSVAWWENPEETDHKKGEVKKASFHGKDWQVNLVMFLLTMKFDIVYAVNLEYDLNNVFRMDQSILKRVYVGSRLLYAEVRNIEFRDAAWFENPPIGVERMGEQLGLPKLKMPHVPRPTPDMITYCERDAEVTLRWVAMVTADFARIKVNLRRTLPSTSLKYFHSVHGNQPKQPDIMIGKMPILDFLREGYYGGRTECFRMKPVYGDIHCADVSSMYPAVMREMEYPSPDSANYTTDPDISVPGAYYCNIHAPPSVRFPVLPYRLDGWTVFPAGSFSGVWTQPEIQAAITAGYDIEPLFGVEYLSCYRPFTEVIDTLYSWKAKGHTRAKFIMNSLYGKFGESGTLTEITAEGEKLIQSTPKHANVIWSAYVTAYARLRLLEGLLMVERNGGESLYCDTDSVFYTADKPLMTGKGLGAWEHKGTETIFECKSPKVYRWGDTFHGKGVPRAEAMGYFLYGMAEYDKPNRYRESLRRGLIVNRWERQRKETTFAYRKRKVLPGGATIPIVLQRGKLK